MLARMALAAAALTFVVIVASAFMRHTQAGLSCGDWPACYARVVTSDADAAPDTGVRVARIAHRLAASGVLALVIGMLLVAWTQTPPWKREGILALAALVIAGALAVLGIATPGARLPAITLGNLLGGYALLAVLAAAAAPASAASRGARNLARLALAFAFVQAALGGMIGAQFASLACPCADGLRRLVVDRLRRGRVLEPAARTGPDRRPPHPTRRRGGLARAASMERVGDRGADRGRRGLAAQVATSSGAGSGGARRHCRRSGRERRFREAGARLCRRAQRQRSAAHRAAGPGEQPGERPVAAPDRAPAAVARRR